MRRAKKKGLPLVQHETALYQDCLAAFWSTSRRNWIHHLSMSEVAERTLLPLADVSRAMRSMLIRCEVTVNYASDWMVQFSLSHIGKRVAVDLGCGHLAANVQNNKKSAGSNGVESV